MLEPAHPQPQGYRSMADPDRLIALDMLRGVAVMGILLMNVAGFGLPQAAYLNPAAYGGASGADLAAWAIGFVLIDGKMRALFSLLFGASMLLVIDRAEQSGRSAGAIHLRRMGSLAVIGAVHAYLIWAGDILIPYAIVGTIAYAYVHRSPRAQLAMAMALLIGQWLLLWSLIAGLEAARDAAMAPGAAAQAIRGWREIADQIGIPAPATIAATLAIYRGSYAGIFNERLDNAAAPLLQLVDVGAETLALMLLGMAGLRIGFLTGRWRRETYLRTALAAYAVGLPILILIAARTIASDFDEIVTVRAALLYAAPARIIVTAGHASMLLWWFGGEEQGGLKARVAAVGRAAFTNYLATSLIMTTIFYGYGAGLFGHLSRAQLYLLPPCLWILMLAWSKPWLDRYRYGPAEWLWRSLARGQRQPLRHAANSIES
jgi:uncharacterized protein